MGTLPHRRVAVSYYLTWQLIRMALDISSEGMKPSLSLLRAYYNKSPDLQVRQLRLYRVTNTLGIIRIDSMSNTGIHTYSEEARDLVASEKDFYKFEMKNVGPPTFWDWNWARQDAAKHSPSVRALYVQYITSRGKPLMPAEMTYFVDILQTTPYEGEGEENA